MSTNTTIPTILDIQDKALLLPDRPQFWTSHHMAEFYQTRPQRVVEQLRRNPDRFPEDFWFELREDEKQVLVTHFAAPSKTNRGVMIGFTHAGALALSGVLKTKVADAVSVQIIRAVVAMEKAAIADAKAMVGKLHTDTLRMKPIYAYIQMCMALGRGHIELMWRGSNYAKWKLEQAARELRAMRIIPNLPEGLQEDLFDV